MNRKKDGACVRKVADVWRVACAMCNVRATMCVLQLCATTVVSHARSELTAKIHQEKGKEREKKKRGVETMRRTASNSFSSESDLFVVLFERAFYYLHSLFEKWKEENIKCLLARALSLSHTHTLSHSPC